MKKLAINTSVFLLATAVLSGCGDDKAVTESDKSAAVVQKVEQVSEKAKQMVDQAADMTGQTIETATEMTDQVVDKGAEMFEQITEKVNGVVEEATVAVDQMVASSDQAATSGIDGEALYKGVCGVCHDMGVADAPKLGDSAAWSARIAQGTEALYGSAINGKGAMPAKGGNPAFSDDEIKAIVDFMVSKAE